MHAVVEALLLSAMLVAIWEWEATVIRQRWPNAAPAVLSFGVPLALLMISYWTPFVVPVGVYSVALFALWFLASGGWKVVGSMTLVVTGVLSALYQSNTSMHTLFVLLSILGVGVFVSAVPRPRSRLLIWGVAYFVLLVAVTDILRIDTDPLHDLVVTAIVAAVDATYVIARAERERRSALHVFRAEHDALTSALTRHGLESWRSLVPAESRDRGMIAACDVDDFKWFNDTWGHDVGDEVLQEFSRRLSLCLRPQDVVIRPGGDEFLVFMPDVRPDDAPMIAQRLHTVATAEPYPLSIGHMEIGVSFGWACGRLDDQTTREADQALLVSKRLGKNRIAHGPSPHSEDKPAVGPRARLGWLADAASVLWAVWSTAAVLTDAEGRIMAVNPSYERLTGHSWANLVGQNPNVLSSVLASRESSEDPWSTLRSGQPWRGTMHNRRPDGEIWRAREWVVPVRMGHEIVGYWAMLDAVEEDALVEEATFHPD